eukprot:NODE_10624_length_281_cov_17.043103_g8855_i0.p4 GENE.NODE_10624_length_281_cov_17.043103_g8855_i0~~NODE_10624_length_281_cov_17.043103_g8855_i0.p4  ORF type:complete len:65 (+),score=2.19 NODE_10624_length_281_cov_17.043103_g8855_i0:58-252(+)
MSVLTVCLPNLSPMFLAPDSLACASSRAMRRVRWAFARPRPAAGSPPLRRLTLPSGAVVFLHGR